jgi:hypothetical protein
MRKEYQLSQLGTSKSAGEIRDCAVKLGLTPQDCYNFDMIVQLDLPRELQVALDAIAAREKRDVTEIIQGALHRFALEQTKPLPQWVGIGEGASDLSERVDELLFQDGMRP